MSAWDPLSGGAVRAMLSAASAGAVSTRLASSDSTPACCFEGDGGPSFGGLLPFLLHFDEVTSTPRLFSRARISFKLGITLLLAHAAGAFAGSAALPRRPARPKRRRLGVGSLVASPSSFSTSCLVSSAPGRSLWYRAASCSSDGALRFTGLPPALLVVSPGVGGSVLIVQHGAAWSWACSDFWLGSACYFRIRTLKEAQPRGSARRRVAAVHFSTLRMARWGR